MNDYEDEDIKSLLEQNSGTTSAFVEELIFDCATDAGFGSDGNGFFVEDIDVTEKLLRFTALMVGKLNLHRNPEGDSTIIQ